MNIQHQHLTPSRGVFISFEGVDGAGKSTHITRLADVLRQQGQQVCLTREPGGTALAEKLRTLLLNDPMDGMTEALLVFAGRRDHLQQVIEPALARGEVVLCDRFTDATFAYQGGGRGFDWAHLETLERMVQTVKQEHGSVVVRQPDVTLWFDLPVNVALERLTTAARLPDRFEGEPAQFFEQVAQAYQRRAHQYPQRFVSLPADQTPEQVWARMENALVLRGYLQPSEAVNG